MDNGRYIMKSEDWMALWIGLFLFLLSLGKLVGVDALGWAASISVWTDLSKAVAPVSTAFAGISPLNSILLTFLFLLIVMTFGAKLLGYEVKKYAISFIVIFVISYISLLLGFYAHIAATPNTFKKFGIISGYGND